ncbi:TonB-dependent receptor [Gaoshiqia sp. Z1-71]|uniref:TonB-dependent receptor n=1 Tax=Gaoshiqia hydrogeniformans TaxID=3290090 RepID=UPI003BF89FD4
MIKKEYLFFLLFMVSLISGAQSAPETVSGSVAGEEGGKTTPLTGVNIYWEGTTLGTSSNDDGQFVIERTAKTNRLIFSYIGYLNDTVEVLSGNIPPVILDASLELNEVEIVQRRKSTEISMLTSIKVEQIGEKELCKAACCNLSESFETSPSIDVTFTDAVTGSRQIQMLGLAGPYVQMARENVPDMRGLASVYGLTLVPGTWIESIQLNKGTGSVVNGYESIAGQINIELRKPKVAERLYLNLFADAESRLEANLNLAHRFENSKWSTVLLLHGKDNSRKLDHNNDGFMDMPTGNTFTALNRWDYTGDDGMFVQFGIKASVLDNQGGELDFKPEDALTTRAWGMNIDVQRLEGWAKIGKVFEDQPWKSIGLQLAGADHEQDSYFGLNTYKAGQQSWYANLIYQSIIGNARHEFKTGTSYQFDDFSEELNDTTYSRNESVPGVFFEYAYLPSDRVSVVAGLRGDYHNLYGVFLTPRLHVRYAPAEQTVLRFSAGRGQRTASVIAENSGVLASSRQLVFQGEKDNRPYGFDPEVAWNYGMNLTQKFQLNYREGSISFDFYRTDFSRQVVMDLDDHPQQALFYQSEAKSRSNSFLAQVDYELVRSLDIRMAYRWYDVKTTYRDGLMQKPLLSRHRAFLNLAYETRNLWSFDYTLNWQGRKRIPFTGSNPGAYRLADYSPDFFLMNAQVSKRWSERFELYAGVENLAGYKQHMPILASDQPFSPYFDSSLIWGPILGRKTYFGLRYKIF